MAEYHESKPPDRCDEITEIHKKYKNFYQVSAGFLLVIILIALGIYIFTTELIGYWTNVYVTLVGTVLTVLVIDRRADQRSIRERKEELILQMGSQHNPFAREAVRILDLKGWLADGSLKNGNFGVADLHGAQLRFADLRGARLEGANLARATLDDAHLEDTNMFLANLEGADLWDTNLERANLRQVNLCYAELHNSNLQNAILSFAKFQHAELFGTNLKGANLLNADLTDADWSDVICDEKTILPDGTFWTSQSGDDVISRFISPKST